MKRRLSLLFSVLTMIIIPSCSNDIISAIKNNSNAYRMLVYTSGLSITWYNETTELNDHDFSISPNDRHVSRTSGVAPLAVHFFADFVDSAEGSERIERFHHYDYTWDFGDAGSGNWGTTEKSKNTAKGAAAVHVFENPGTYSVVLTIRNHSRVVDTENYSITVTDPNAAYSGTNTTCVNNAGDTDFSAAPAGARTISTNDLSTIVQYATSGSRILFKRGSSWTTAGLTWPDNAGPVTIGAYGTGINPDTLGIYDNAPRITVTGGNFLNLSFKQDWRIMDLHLIDTTRRNGSFGGASDMQRLLFYRLNIEGFGVGLGWTHWNERSLMRIDDMVVASCAISGSATNIVYVGSERLALLGNIMHDAQQSHVVRVWQAYRSVIGHNMISGSSVNSAEGRHALKLHGPGLRPGSISGTSLGVPTPGTGLLDVKTQFTIVADNIFGSSGPWPVAIGPQDGQADERLSHIIFERNRIHPDYGTQSVTTVQVALIVWARHCTIRNNIIDGTGANRYFDGMVVDRRGIEPAPTNVEIYHNTIYRGDNVSVTPTAIQIGAVVTDSEARNNLASFPYASGPVTLVEDLSGVLARSNNLLTDDARFVLPGAADPLARDYRLQAGSPALGQGASVPVFDDFFMNFRPASSADLGALEQ